MKKCQNVLCDANNPNVAIYCHMCGDKLPVRKRHYGWILAVMVSILLSGGLICYFNCNYTTNTYNKSYIITQIETLCNAVENDDFVIIESIYALHVKRYHSIYNISRDVVIDKYRNYNQKFGVYGKYISVRWNTISVNEINGRSYVTYIYDYHIDRMDKSKYSNFEIEKHLEFDEDYRIVSEYDVQLSKSK